MDKISSARFRLMAGAVTCVVMGLIALAKWQVNADGWGWYVVLTGIAVMGVAYTALIGTEVSFSVGVHRGLPQVILMVSEYVEEPPEGLHSCTHWAKDEEAVHKHRQVIWEIGTPSSWE